MCGARGPVKQQGVIICDTAVVTAGTASVQCRTRAQACLWISERDVPYDVCRPRNVGEWLWQHFDDVVGLSFLNFDGGHYKLAPYEEITKEVYESEMLEMPKAIDFGLLQFYEQEDRTEGAVTLACVSGSCEINWGDLLAEKQEIA